MNIKHTYTISKNRAQALLVYAIIAEMDPDDLTQTLLNYLIWSGREGIDSVHTLDVIADRAELNDNDIFTQTFMPGFLDDET